MRALKSIVVLLGALIIVAFGVLVYGLSKNWHRLNEPPGAAATSAPGPAAVTAQGPAKPPVVWGRVDLGQPPDSHIQGVTSAGNLLVVQVASGSDERLLVLDPATGAIVGTFAVTGKPMTGKP